MDNTATNIQFVIADRCCLVLQLSGKEALNQAFSFDIKIKHSFDQLEQYLDQPATLLIRHFTTTIRSIRGRIAAILQHPRIDEEMFLSSVKFVASLYYSLFLNGAGRHQQQDIISLTRKLLMQSHYSSEQILVKVNKSYTDKRVLLQIPNESNYSFLLRILLNNTLHFYCDYDDVLGETIIIFDKINSEHLSTAIKSGLFHFKERVVDEWSNSRHLVTAHSHLASNKLTQAVIIDDEFCAGNYYISSIEHHYDALQAIYKNQLELTVNSHFPVCQVSNQLDLALCYSGEIINKTLATELDQLGRYHAYYSFELNKQETLHDVPMSYRALINSQSNFPLVNHSSILLTHVNGCAQQPLIIAALPNEYLPSPINYYNQTQHLLKTSSGNQLCFNDSPNLNAVHLGNHIFHNTISLHNNKHASSFDVHNDHGDINLTAKDNITITNRSDNLRAMQSLYRAQQAIKLSSQKGSLFNQSQQETTITAHNYLHLSANKTMQLNSHQNFYITAKNSMNLTSKNTLNLTTMNERITLQAVNGIMLTNGALRKIWIGKNKKTAIEINDRQITINCQHLILKVQNTIFFHGKINYCGMSPRLTIPVYPKSLPATLLAPRKSHPTLKVYHLHWRQSLLDCNQQQLAIFTLYNDSDLLNGNITIFHCASDDETAINNPAIIDDCRYETRRPIDTKRFQLQPNKKHQQLYVAYTYQPVNANYLKQYNYLRFSVNLGDKSSYFLSAPMQWCKDLQLKLQSEKQLSYSDPITLGLRQSALLSSPSQQHSCLFEQLIIGIPSYVTVLKSEQAQVYELLNHNKTNPQLSQRLILNTTKQQTETMPLYLLTPPMIVNARDDAQPDDRTTRTDLSTTEYQQINKNGNSLTLFIHGFNINYGQFSKHIESVNSCDSEANIDVQLSQHNATIYRSASQLKKQFPLLETVSNQHCNDLFLDLNGCGMHNWLLHMENNINKAAGFDGNHYDKFTRLLHFAWQGDTAKRYDYLAAVKQSLLVATKLAALIKTIKLAAPNLQLNIIAHSQGNAAVIAAMEALKEPLINRVILWQAAVPYDCLSPHQFLGRHFSSLSVDELQQYQHQRSFDPGYTPFAHQAAKKITILHSYNDNILGPIPAKQSQVLQNRVNRHKPVDELVSALFLSYMQLGSLYELAYWIGVPISCLLTWPGQQQAYQFLKQRFLNKSYPNTLMEQIEINEQQDNDLKLFAQLSQRLTKVKRRIIYQLKVAGHPDLAAIVTVANFAFSHPFWTAFLLGGGAGVATVEKVDNNLTSLTIVKGLLTLLDMLLLNRSINVKPALGYCGPTPKQHPCDNSMQSLLTSSKITVIDQSDYYFSHSALKEPSDELLKKVYQGVITNPNLGLKHFGTYY